MPPPPPRAPSPRALATACGAIISGGLLLTAAELVPLPRAVSVIGLGWLLVGGAIVAVLGVRYGRASGRSILGSAWFALRAVVRWLWFFMP